MTKPTKQQELKHDMEYVEFLKKRLASPRYKANVSKEEYEATKAKLEKAKFRVRILNK